MRFITVLLTLLASSIVAAQGPELEEKDLEARKTGDQGAAGGGTLESDGKTMHKPRNAVEAQVTSMP
ncbi:hypothetical protein QTJ16_005514 [Diplocarpon rosae]|uniref:Uncharacterized protein n=1 Tax=Diplocarpon rosae TaxID=946125 RepID=A0AAD9SYR8_9HELO|nr:hypothetical protein QTJ16_005514 [Diplocarpon rosae]